MSAFCPDCGREIVTGYTETGHRIVLSVPPERRYHFAYEYKARPIVRETDTYLPHPPDCASAAKAGGGPA